MDIYTLIVIGHVVGTILGTGGATVAELQIHTAIKGGKRITPEERALMHVNYTMIRFGMGILLASVIAMFFYFQSIGSNYLFTTEKLWMKDVMFAAIFINAICLQKRWVPLWLGASVSFTSWWGATLLGLARDIPYSFVTLFISYAVAVFAVAAFLQFMHRTRMNKKNILIALTVLVIAVFGVYALSNNQQVEAPVTNEETASRELVEAIKFDAPGITHHVEFTVTLDEAELIQDVSATELDHEGYEEKLASFSETLTTTIKGKKLSELEAVDKVGTSSLTTTAFNEALAKMQETL